MGPWTNSHGLCGKQKYGAQTISTRKLIFLILFFVTAFFMNAGENDDYFCMPCLVLC